MTVDCASIVRLHHGYEKTAPLVLAFDDHLCWFVCGVGCGVGCDLTNCTLLGSRSLLAINPTVLPCMSNRGFIGTPTGVPCNQKHANDATISTY